MIFAFFLIFFQTIFFSNYNSKIIKYMANFAAKKYFCNTSPLSTFFAKNTNLCTDTFFLYE